MNDHSVVVITTNLHNYWSENNYVLKLGHNSRECVNESVQKKQKNNATERSIQQ